MFSPNFIFVLVIFATGALSSPPFSGRGGIFNNGWSGANFPHADFKGPAVGSKLPVADVKLSLGNGVSASVNEGRKITFNQGLSGAKLAAAVEAKRLAVEAKLPEANIKVSLGNRLSVSVNEGGKLISNQDLSGAKLPAFDAKRPAVGAKPPVADAKSSVGNGISTSVDGGSNVSMSTNLTSTESATNLTSIVEATIRNLTATAEEESETNVTSVSGANVTTTAANVTSTVGAAMTNSSDVDGAASIEKLQGFNETKFISENAVDFSNVPIPSVKENITCERGYRFVNNACQLSKWRRDSLRNLIAPKCEVHSHCTMNAICDPDENLCKCVNGLPISATSCEGSAFGEKCDDNTECKSWDLDCKEGFCACLPGHHREKEGCVRLIALDNECTFGGTPCYGMHVACLGARGESCPANTTCACRCENGYEKDQKNKVCVKPKPASESPKSKRAGDDVEPTTLPTTTTTVMTTTTSTTNDASIMTPSRVVSIFIGFALLFIFS